MFALFNRFAGPHRLAGLNQLTVSVLVATSGFWASTVAAQQPASPCANFSRPVVCDLSIRVSNDGRDWRTLKSVDTLRIGQNSSLNIEVVGIAQDGREFPAERMIVGLDPDRSFDRYFQIEEQGRARMRISAGDDRGTGSVRIWMPGNYNLERELRIEIGNESNPGAPQADAVVVADALYKAILGRQPDDRGRELAIREIQQGNAAKLARGMLTSKEFTQNRMRMPADELLNQFYLGLLGREADPGGKAAYMPQMRSGKFADVVTKLMDSDEFKKKMMER